MSEAMAATPSVLQLSTRTISCPPPPFNPANAVSTGSIRAAPLNVQMTTENARPFTVLLLRSQHRPPRPACLAEVDAHQRRQLVFEGFEQRQGTQSQHRRLGEKLDATPPRQAGSGGPPQERPAHAFFPGLDGRRKPAGQQFRAFASPIDRSIDGAAHGLDGLLAAQKAIEAPPMWANRRRAGVHRTRPPDAEGLAQEVDIVPDAKGPDPLLQNCIRYIIGPQVRTAVDSPEKRAVGNRQPPEQRHLKLFGTPSPFGMAITQRGRGGNLSGRIACLRFLYRLIALDDAHVMGVHDRNIARQEFAMPEIVVFEGCEMRAA